MSVNYFLLDSLMNRLQEYWDVQPNEIAYKLYEEYYTRCLEDHLFDLDEFDPMVIVDNDWVNWMSVMTDEELAENGLTEDDVEVTLTDDDGTVCHLVRVA